MCLVSAAAWAATPAERGPFGVAELHEHLTDPSRGREMDLLVLHPSSVDGAKVPASGLPLIVFTHGFLLSGGLYRSYGEHLASHGFVVLLPTYPMSFFDLDHSALALNVHHIIDHCLASDANSESALYGLVDESLIGASGHSLGGKLALLEAVIDARIGAIATLDPVDGSGPVAGDPIRYPSVTPELMPKISVPLLFVGAELGSVAYSLMPCAPLADNYQRFYEAANSPAMKITQLGAGHGQYVDPGAEAMMMACAPGTAAAEWVRASATAYLTAFFLWHLRGDGGALEWLDNRLAEDETSGLIRVQQK